MDHIYYVGGLFRSVRIQRRHRSAAMTLSNLNFISLQHKLAVIELFSANNSVSLGLTVFGLSFVTQIC